MLAKGGTRLETIYDWITVAIFCGLIVLFLQRSISVGPAQDSIWQYLGASVGCAVANWLGNRAVEESSALHHLLAVAVIGATLAYIHFTLKPFDRQA